MTTATSPVVRTANERRRFGSIAWHVGALVILAVILYPVIWVLGASFKPSKDIIASIDLLPAKPVWANFSGLADGISGISISTFFVNSLIYAGLAVAGVVLSSSLTAYAFAKIRFAGRNLLFTLMIGTLLLPYHVLLIPQYVMFRKLELVDTLVPLVAGKFLATEAFFVFLMVQFMRGLPRRAGRGRQAGRLRAPADLLVDRAAAVPARPHHQRDLHLHQRLERLHGAVDLPQRPPTSTPSRSA